MELQKEKNRTLIEATRNMLADSLLPMPFWAEAVNTACYVQNRVLVTKPHNKTPYELLLGRTPSIGFIRPFGCPVTILNTLDPLGKFDGKANKGFLVGYPVNRSGPTWLFDIDTLTQSMNYQPTGNQPNSSAGIQGNFNAGKVGMEYISAQQYVLLPLWSTGSKDPQNTDGDDAFDDKQTESKVHVSPKFSVNSTNMVTAASVPVTAVGLNSTNSTNSFNDVGPFDNAISRNFEIGGKSSFVDPSQYPNDPDMPALEDIIYSDDEGDVGTEADFSNLEASITVSPILTFRVHKDHPVTQIINDLSSAPQTRSMTRTVKEQGFKDPDYLDKVYKLVKALYGLHQAPRSWYETLANYLLENGFQRGKIDQTLFIKKQKDKFNGRTHFVFRIRSKAKGEWDIYSQDKYVAKILRKFGLTDGKSSSIPINAEKPLLKDTDEDDLLSKDVQRDIMDRKCAYLTNQHDVTTSPLGLVPGTKYVDKLVICNLIIFSIRFCLIDVLKR
nr:ribonuclease H-like domain-containing protein [Tanacetum cinerariifolium]